MQSDQQGLNDGKRHNKFVRFLLKSWQPVPTWQSTIILFTILGIGLVAFGIVLVAINASIVEKSQQYDVSCGLPSANPDCNVTITLTEKMEAPIYFYYEIDNFYQNHRRYINSRSATQLSGTVISDSTASSDCTPAVTNDQMGVTWMKPTLVGNETAIPCGLIAKSFFNDTYIMYDSSNNEVAIDDTGIAWPSDKEKKFKNTGNMDKQWLDMTDEHFIVWMRTAGLPNFRKLWGKINKNLDVGTYTVSVDNNYDVSTFEGKKLIVLSETGPFGGKNNFLAISYIVVGGVCLLIAVFFGVRWMHYKKKNM